MLAGINQSSHNQSVGVLSSIKLDLLFVLGVCVWGGGGASIQKQNSMTYVCFAVMSVSLEVVLWKITSKTILIIQQHPVLSVEGTWAGVYLYGNVKRTRAKHIKGSKERYLLLYWDKLQHANFRGKPLFSR